MAHNINRTFSFDNDDEMALSSHEQEPFDYYTAQQGQQQTRYPPTHDVPLSPPPRYASPPSPVRQTPVSPLQTHRYHPSTHPDSVFSRLRGHRQGSGDHELPELPPPNDVPPQGPRPPPNVAHRRIPSSEAAVDGRYWGREVGYTQSQRTQLTATPGMDNLGTTATGGGIAGVAYGVANSNEMERERELDASRATYNARHRPHDDLPERQYETSDTPYIPQPSSSSPPRNLRQTDSYGSTYALNAGAATPGHATPMPGTPGYPRSEQGSLNSYEYPQTQYLGAPGYHDDSPYQRRSAYDLRLPQASINPDDIIDDGDDGFTPNPKRRSNLDLRGNTSHDIRPAAAAGAGGAAAGGVLGNIGGFMGRHPKPNTASGTYGPVGQGEGGNVEKSEWMGRKKMSSRKKRLVVAILVIIGIIIAIVAGVVGGVLGSKNGSGGSGGSQGESASDDDGKGDLGKDSAEIKALSNNPDLHKVFPGMDYTPFNAQYPACLSNPPSQNNVTRDIAVLSQLTNTIRLYGTDCNQTAMVVHAFDRLGLSDMKLWLGVWIDTNKTSSNRQLNQMYDLLEHGPGKSYFKGAIIGNEALFHGFTETQLGSILQDVRENFTTKNIDVPLATSDLGSNWSGALASLVDVVMSNVHPFFAGVTAEKAADWTWQFWQENDVVLTKGMANKKQIIAEVGWPSGGGNDCGPSQPTCATKTSGSVAGIDEMNTFMTGWVCESLTNGTDYFWFEAFDEPWKGPVFNTPGKEWEDKWGLMTIDRKLKPGLNIPSCGGKTVS